MPDDINSPVVAVGGVTVAATTGALIAMGHRAGSVGLPFAAIGALVLRRTVAGGEIGLILVGLAVHVAAMCVWAGVFVWILKHYVRRDTIAAILVAVAEFVISGIAASATGQGVASILPLGDRIVFATILAASLVVGIRLAFPRGQRA